MKELVINVSPLETRIAILEDGHLAELHIERAENRSLVGNIYKGRVDSVVPGIQAAFVDIGFEKNGFLYVSDIAEANEGDVDFVDGTAKVRKSRSRANHPPIESILKRNQSIMVQVAKDTLGTKGCRLTNYVTVPGRFTVLMPTVSHLGVSRKIEDGRERDRIRRILKDVRPKGVGLICRTAAEGKEKSEIEDDARYVSKVWSTVNRKMDKAKAPSLLYGDLGPIRRIVRDRFTSEFGKLTVDDETEYNNILDFLDNFAPNLKKNVKLYKQRRPLFDRMGIESEIDKALNRKVVLPSGGHICIDPTEALVSIDVNTGRFTGKTNLEDTVFKTNLEAADEIARQVRLRDIGGIIVCDFIDMRYERNRRELLRRMQDALRDDRSKTTVSEVSELGLIEMTRKRVKHTLTNALSQTCPYCEGSGHVRSVTTMTFDLIRRLQETFCDSKEKSVIVQVHPDVARRLRNENKNLLDDVAAEFEREISVESVADFHIHDVCLLSERTRKVIKHWGLIPSD